MKCLSCDVILTDAEATTKTKSGEFLDLCYNCLITIPEYYNLFDAELENGNDEL